MRCATARRPCRGHHGAYRGGGRAFRRQRLLPAAAFALAETVAELKRQTEAMARALNVVGLMNVQFAIKDGDDLRARGEPPRQPHRALRRQGHRQRHRLHRRAADGGRAAVELPDAPALPRGRRPRHPLPLADPLTLADPITPWFSVKEAVLPFARFPGVDTLLGPEMRSTGEVMGWDRTFALAFLKAQMGAGTHLPDRGPRVPVDQGCRQDRRPGRRRARPGRDGLRDRRHPRHRRSGWPRRASPPTPSTRSTKAARTSSTG
jgi:hypothetical protein